MADLSKTLQAANVADLVVNFDCGENGNDRNVFHETESDWNWVNSIKKCPDWFVENLFVFVCDLKELRISSL